LLIAQQQAASFAPHHYQTAFRRTNPTKSLVVSRTTANVLVPQQPLPPRPAFLFAVQKDSEEEEEDDDNSNTSETNPYADPNYPDLEFVNYADPEYKVDQGVSDEFFDTSSSNTVEEQVEAMREDRRRRNDEFQFQTYYQKVLRNGDSEFRGEWTVYRTSTFLDNDPEIDKDDAGLPRLVRATGSTPLTVVSRGYKEMVDVADNKNGKAAPAAAAAAAGGEQPVVLYAVDAERIVHVEEIRQPTAMGDADIASFYGKAEELEVAAPNTESEQQQHAATEKEIMGNSYWPDLLKAKDFRGHQGIMVCGK